jgi:NAD dependent epimerase/dehydratase family enzyme
MKKQGLIITATVLILLSACKNPGISDNEKKGIKEVVNLYGGNVKYAKEDSAAVKKNIFEIQLSKSRFADSYIQNPELPASGVAYAFYKKLGNDKQKYTHIKSELVLSDGEKVEYEYPVNELEIVNSKIKIAEKITDLIKQRNFEAIKPMLDDSSYAQYNKDEFIKNLEETDLQHAKANELVIIGYRFYKIYGKDILHISGQLMRGATANAFSIDIDPNDPKERAVMINYNI